MRTFRIQMELAFFTVFQKIFHKGNRVYGRNDLIRACCPDKRGRKMSQISPVKAEILKESFPLLSLISAEQIVIRITRYAKLACNNGIAKTNSFNIYFISIKIPMIQFGRHRQLNGLSALSWDIPRVPCVA